MKRDYVAALIALALLTLLSLILNGIVILAFLQLRETALCFVTDARSLINDMADDRFSHTVDVEQEIPISTEIPFSETFSVPINTVVPISTTVVVPVNLGFTVYDLEVPIETVLPIDMDVMVPVSQVVDVNTVVPLDVEVPIDIGVYDTPLAHYLNGMDATLKQAEEQLGRPVWQVIDHQR